MPRNSDVISVIIPTYNEEKNIERCLTAITNQSIPRDQIEIIVVDGGSSDRTCMLAEKQADKVIQQESMGVGGARNDGFKIAKGSIVATTDADCKPCRDWVASIQEEFMDPEVVAVTGFQNGFDWENMNRFEIFVYDKLIKFANMVYIAVSKINHYHLCGANTAFRKDILFEIGGYLPLVYGDDIEIFHRVKKKGQVRLNRGMMVDYSVRRMRKMGLFNYIRFSAKMFLEVMILGQKPIKGDYARQNYD